MARQQSRCIRGSAVVLVTIAGFLLLVLSCNKKNSPSDSPRREISFDDGWRFKKDSGDTAKDIAFNDAAWRVLDLPHDWSIEDLPDQKPDETIGPFSRASEGPMNGQSTGHVVGGTGWYRKTFSLNKEEKGKSITLYFEGVYMEADVWINGQFIGNHKHGYTSFYFDITKYCFPAGENNLLAVRVTNNGQNSRWYSGSGIYRHVKLIITNPAHFDPWNVYISTPEVTNERSMVLVTAGFSNSDPLRNNFTVVVDITDPDGKTVATDELKVGKAESSSPVTLKLPIPSPILWSINSPRLYHANVRLMNNGMVKDAVSIEFGIRSISFDAVSGFLLNGKEVKLKGGCIHHDNGILGSAAIDRAEQRKIELLKANGFNAIRCSHNPPSEKLLETCDRLGMLVIDEPFDMWEKPKNTDDYHKYFDEWWERDLSAMVVRDRNHPSIILWSAGNEIQERADSAGLLILQKIKTKIKQLDATRPITMAVCEFWDNPGKPWPATAPTFGLLDVGGYNYQWWHYEPDHNSFPKRIMVGTESVPMHAFENWELVEKHPYVIGDFVWTAMDYLGESGIGNTSCEEANDDQFLRPWPWFNANCGDIDLIGQKKPQSRYRDVVWGNKKLEMVVHTPMVKGCTEKISYWGWPDQLDSWTWPGNEGQSVEVSVFSRYPAIRLELNGKPIAEKTIPDSAKYIAKFNVAYSSGDLVAIGMEGGKEVERYSLKTAGEPQSIRLTADRLSIDANRNDLSYVTVEVVDADMNVVPYAKIPISFSISGNGELAAAGSADPSGMSSFHLPLSTTYHGRCLAILRPKGNAGKIVLEAKANGLKGATLTIDTK